MNKSITFLMKQMVGGGAERVISLLCNELNKRNYEVTLLITHQSKAEANLSTLDPGVSVLSLTDEVKSSSENKKKLLMLKARLSAKFRRVVLKRSDNQYLVKKYEIRNYDKVQWLKRFFSQKSRNTLVAFLYDAIFLTLLSASKSDIIIISERSDPRQCMSGKTNQAFFQTMFNRADAMVFQSPDVMQWYKDNLSITGKVIFNPLKPDLPERYVGQRKKNIVNFCRISSAKKLDTLIDAFDRFAEAHNDYELYIYGDPDDAEPDYMRFVENKISLAKSKEKIHLLPARQDIHTEILDDSMFVSSSFFEGMSNSMLEAMAIGLPTICTDCPAGGARAVIRDHENGILVPVNDVQAMANAMKEVAEDAALAEKLSVNGTKIKKELAVDKIVNQWMEIIDG